MLTLAVSTQEAERIKAGRSLIVRRGVMCENPTSCPPLTRQMCRWHGFHAPEELEALSPALVCRCAGTHQKLVPIITIEGNEPPWRPCTECTIHLIGPCPKCNGDRLPNGNVCGCYPHGTITLGYAYAEMPLMQFKPWAGHIDPPTGQWIGVSETGAAIQRADKFSLVSGPGIIDQAKFYAENIEDLMWDWAIYLRNAT